MAGSGTTIQVQPEQITAAGSTVKGAGSTVQGAAGGLTSAGISGGFTTGEAISQLCAQWSAGMKAFADACNSVASSLDQAGTKYPITENTLSQRYGR